jgi:REP element-mobilizing transposase RayT
MPQSLSNILIHLIFSTKNRNPLIRPELRDELQAYLGGVLANMSCPVLVLGGVEDHMHILFQLSRTLSMAKVVEEVKTSSSRWLKTKGINDFYWQTGYGAFSIGRSEVGAVSNYIRTQEEHHRKISFQDEYRQLLSDFGIEFDERYVWD